MACYTLHVQILSTRLNAFMETQQPIEFESDQVEFKISNISKKWDIKCLNSPVVSHNCYIDRTSCKFGIKLSGLHGFYTIMGSRVNNDIGIIVKMQLCMPIIYTALSEFGALILSLQIQLMVVRSIKLIINCRNLTVKAYTTNRGSTNLENKLLLELQFVVLILG